MNKLAFSIVIKWLSHTEDERPSFKAIIQTIKRNEIKLIDGIDDKIQIIRDHLKSIIKMKRSNNENDIRKWTKNFLCLLES